MRAAIRMWNNTRMVILVAVCSAIYGAALIAFKTAIPLIPGITEVRVANIFPVVFSLLFGPAGAWGSAIGNLIGDLFGGTLGPGSLPGFVGNFLLGYLPYNLWTTFFPFSAGSREWRSGDWKSWVTYIFVAIVSSTACAVVIGTAVDALGIVPYSILTKIITINNTFASFIGIILLASVFNLIKQHLGLFWVDVMEEKDIRTPSLAPIGAWIVTVASMAGLTGGMVTSLPATMIGWVCAFAILLGSFLL